MSLYRLNLPDLYRTELQVRTGSRKFHGLFVVHSLDLKEAADHFFRFRLGSIRDGAAAENASGTVLKLFASYQMSFGSHPIAPFRIPPDDCLNLIGADLCESGRVLVKQEQVIGHIDVSLQADDAGVRKKSTRIEDFFVSADFAPEVIGVSGVYTRKQPVTKTMRRS